MTTLQKIKNYLDKELDIANFQDYPGAYNGLQIENSGQVSRIAFAVDACEATIEMAVAAKANLLVTHHSLFFGGSAPVTGATYRKLRLALGNDLALYSAHLPLDAHPRLGNNAQIARALGFRGKLEPFLENHGRPIGFRTRANISRKELRARLEKLTGRSARLISGGLEKIRSIGIVSGGSGDDIVKMASLGIDTFISGEGPHWSAAVAHETGVNLLYGGHYATETFGVRALLDCLSTKFALPCIFLENPSGL